MGGSESVVNGHAYCGLLQRWPEHSGLELRAGVEPRDAARHDWRRRSDRVPGVRELSARCVQQDDRGVDRLRAGEHLRQPHRPL